MDWEIRLEVNKRRGKQLEIKVMSLWGRIKRLVWYETSLAQGYQIRRCICVGKQWSSMKLTWLVISRGSVSGIGSEAGNAILSYPVTKRRFGLCNGGLACWIIAIENATQTHSSNAATLERDTDAQNRDQNFLLKWRRALSNPISRQMHHSGLFVLPPNHVRASRYTYITVGPKNDRTLFCLSAHELSASFFPATKLPKYVLNFLTSRFSIFFSVFIRPLFSIAKELLFLTLPLTTAEMKIFLVRKVC